MLQMVRLLLQWLNNLFKYPFGSRRTHEFDGDEVFMVERSLPELTNADLEVLFNELLEGVHQARGQQWALKYLQRMEPRITVERWIDWLLIFGEKLLSSPAPNSKIATRMVKLGELNIGKVGELASEIGIQLLSREFLPQNLQQNLQRTPQPAAVAATPPAKPSLKTPRQRLLGDLGEQLWEYEQKETVDIAPASMRLEESWPSNIQHLSDQNAVAEISEAVIYELAAEEHPQTVEEEVEEVAASPLAENWDQSLTNLQPQVAQTLDELVVRLEQSTSLVQQLASELALRDAYDGQSHRPAITQRPNFQLTVTNQAEVLFDQGLQQAKSGDLLGALAFYSQAIKLQPESYEYWFNQGLALFHLQRFEEAISAYDQAINLKPDFAKAWYNRGGVLGELGDFDGAIASFDQAIELKFEYQEAWASRGLALLKLGLIWEAISSYDQALKLQPEDQETWYYRGVALGVGEQFEEAIASYDQALEIQPDYHEVWIDRGVVLFNLKRWSEAIESWDEALAIQSDFYLAWYNRGIALENLGRRGESIESYQQAITIKPDFHLAWYNQAVALFYLGRLTEAISCYDSALEIKLDYWEAWLGRALAVGNVVNNKASLSLPSSIAKSHPTLNQGGYEGKIATYEEGLKHLRPDTHPEGWGRLHLALGNTHYEHGKKQPSPRYYWQQAVSEYTQALLTLTSANFAELHLEVLQALTKVLVALGETETAQELQQQGLDLLQQLLNQITCSEQNKKQLALKFAGFIQLGVDLAVNTGDLVEAWEIAEHGKNTCLKLQLSGWSNEIYSPNYQGIQQLLNPQTVVIYWHLSPVALQTFIIKHDAPSPLLLLTPIQNREGVPEAVQRLVEFENWLEFWQKEYQEYCQNPDLENPLNHSWCVDMEGRLLNLRNILNIPTILQEIEGITHLILIPHRDLHKLPLHALFAVEQPDANYTINYLPSVQIGLELNTDGLSNWQLQKFLSVENIEHTSNDEIQFVDFAAAVVRQMFNNAQHIQGSQATKDNLENALAADYNILHFTGHAVNNLSEVAKSALVLADEDKLTLSEISQQTFSNYNLFTFTNSENVSHNIQNISSEYVGLTTGLLNSGVPYVLSTLWNVESSANALVIIEFYNRLLFHHSPVTALAEATTWLKEITVAELITWYENLFNNLHLEELKLRDFVTMQIDKHRQLSPQKQPYNHPYYWAGFILSGCG
ncbi:CHAT domain-containing protein [Sphaerospermopsis torques-reginae]|uniref:Tetratricopeptide repeat protein n=1 Tax=Sphaerospermopsis torques-reginae ITEP-024 TaxID=984208 RepID=A0ABX8X1J9_9CYAN|nr:tetratricopeptide repeat protein [Sphaerospermopsis torques-reginae]QYX32547.1 tetratricopeptide repeat protein [Sphaerospermopsis torques-reginae ITEP-024]